MGTENRSSPGARFSLLDATTTLRPPLLKKLLSNIEDGGAAPFSGAPRCAHVSLVSVFVVHADTHITENSRKREKDSRGMECIFFTTTTFFKSVQLTMEGTIILNAITLFRDLQGPSKSKPAFLSSLDTVHTESYSVKEPQPESLYAVNSSEHDYFPYGITCAKLRLPRDRWSVPIRSMILVYKKEYINSIINKSHDD